MDVGPGDFPFAAAAIVTVFGGASLLIGCSAVYFALLAAIAAWRWRRPGMAVVALGLGACGLLLIAAALVGVLVVASPETVQAHAQAVQQVQAAKARRNDGAQGMACERARVEFTRRLAAELGKESPL